MPPKGVGFPDPLSATLNRISQIIAGKRAITGDTALRLGHWFGTDPQFWLNLQSQHDLALADRRSGDAIRALRTRANQEAPADIIPNVIWQAATREFVPLRAAAAAMRQRLEKGRDGHRN